MPFIIVRNDITKMEVDAIVNSANQEPLVGGGVDLAINQAAGLNLIYARNKHGLIETGDAIITPGFNLPAKYVIHTVGPIWQGGKQNERQLLKNAYLSCLNLAQKNKLESIAFPLISAGVFGYPSQQALAVALEAFKLFLKENEMLIYLIVFDQQSFRLSKSIVKDVHAFIDDNYVEKRCLSIDDRVLENLEIESRGVKQMRSSSSLIKPKIIRRNMEDEQAEDVGLQAYRDLRQTVPKRSISDLLDYIEEGFVETLFRLIARKGLADAEVYKKANIDRKHFSKIRSNADYQPSKVTAIALAIALELNLDDTKDFLAKAGYALSKSNKFDLIIEYFVKREIYDLFEINSILFQFNQKLIGV